MREFEVGINPFMWVSVMFPVVFALIIGIISFSIFSGMKTYVKNNHSPRLTVQALIVTKRENISTHRRYNEGDISGASGSYVSHHTRYYVTFEVSSGDRMEFEVSGDDYGLLVDGDYGDLSFQGTRFLGFERT